MSFLAVRRDLGAGVTLDVDDIALPEKYAVAVLLGIATCEGPGLHQAAVMLLLLSFTL